MIKLSYLIRILFFLIISEWSVKHVEGQMLGQWGSARPMRGDQRLHSRQNRNGNGNNNNNNNNNNNGNGPNKDGFNIVNGRILTPGLGIVLAPQPFTPMGGDFLHIALDVSGDGKLQVPPRNIDDPLTQVFNFTLFLTSTVLNKNFTISNITTTTPPLANIMNQESGQTVKHINFEWPDCLVGDGKEDFNTTARGDYNISIHQNFRLNGSNHYSIFNLPISVTNSISQFPGASQLLTKPAPGPLSATGGRMNCDMISNPVMDFSALVRSVNNPPGQPFQDIAIETTQRTDGGQVGGPGSSNGGGGRGSTGNGNGNGGQGSIGTGNTGTNANGALGAASKSVNVGWVGMWSMAVFTVLVSTVG